MLEADEETQKKIRTEINELEALKEAVENGTDVKTLNDKMEELNEEKETEEKPTLETISEEN